jgi:hypothetical protein
MHYSKSTNIERTLYLCFEKNPTNIVTVMFAKHTHNKAGGLLSFLKIYVIEKKPPKNQVRCNFTTGELKQV